jgi:hypothetical protein
VVNNLIGQAPVIIAISAPRYKQDEVYGIVCVYECTTQRCFQVGDVLGIGHEDGPDIAFAMSGNGEFLAVSVGYNSVRVYHTSNLEGGEEVGVIVSTDNSTIIFGSTLSLSGNGDLLAVGSESDSDTFLVQMYKWNGTSYVTHGTELETSRPLSSGILYPVHAAAVLSSDAMVLSFALVFGKDVPETGD